jgi:disulfide bond formation protein DsbB
VEPISFCYHLPTIQVPHLPTHLLLQREFSPQPECSEVLKALPFNMIAMSYMWQLKIRFKLI